MVPIYMGLDKPYSNATRTKVALSALLAMLVVGTQTVSAETTALANDDWVGISFWIATAMMLAFTVFFLVERQNVPDKWKTSMTVAALVTGVAWYHYTYMREVWAMGDGSPLVYRYIDWLITVPLQVVEFYLILAAIGVGTFVMFRNLMAASIVMLVAGFFGESGAMDSVIESVSRNLVGHWNGRMGIHPIRAMVRRRQGGFRDLVAQESSSHSTP